MRYSNAHLDSALQITGLYTGDEPIASFLKKYFRSNPRHGSTDRRNITHYCYCLYRIGNMFSNLPVEERMIRGIFLCTGYPVSAVGNRHPEWSRFTAESPAVKLRMMNAGEELENLFPYNDLLSREIDPADFSLSFLVQPRLYLRIRPGHISRVLDKLKHSDADFSLPDENAVALPVSFKVNEMFQLNREVVVQDISSQQVMKTLIDHLDQRVNYSVWDCCSASGGKSILAWDSLQRMDLTVSDIRSSILANLRKRFGEAGISNYKWFVADVARSGFSPGRHFDIIICDAPCSGSGTWSRTPEQLAFFKRESVEYYAELQKKILLNAAGALKPGGFLLYITCSVFEEENEAVAGWFGESTGMTPVSVKYYPGYRDKADTLFAALFRAT